MKPSRAIQRGFVAEAKGLDFDALTQRTSTAAVKAVLPEALTVITAPTVTRELVPVVVRRLAAHGWRIELGRASHHHKVAIALGHIAPFHPQAWVAEVKFHRRLGDMARRWAWWPLSMQPPAQCYQDLL